MPTAHSSMCWQSRVHAIRHRRSPINTRGWLVVCNTNHIGEWAAKHPAAMMLMEMISLRQSHQMRWRDITITQRFPALDPEPVGDALPPGPPDTTTVAARWA